MLSRVLDVGHSFIKRLENMTNENLDWVNLGLDGTTVQVEFLGVPGGTLHIKSSRSIQHRIGNISVQYKCIFLQIGGNDFGFG